MFAPFLTTGIGSLPHTDPEEACRLVLDTFDIPFWPQLPKLSFHEFMIPQYSEGMPFLKIDEKKEMVWIEKDGNSLTRFYETYSEDLKLAISEEYARGFYTFITAVKNRHFKYLKGHVTGPLTFTLGLKDSDGKLVYFDEELREISLMVLKAKIRWQIEALKPCAEQVIIFIDEPILLHSAIELYRRIAGRGIKAFEETSDAIRSLRYFRIHCCSN
jgi:hypothetical protein